MAALVASLLTTLLSFGSVEAVFLCLNEGTAADVVSAVATFPPGARDPCVLMDPNLGCAVPTLTHDCSILWSLVPSRGVYRPQIAL